ncbi:hypothetical protein L873DRAFT_1811422 [Choiromyces venosus 120613-1]|uniref:Uncharacterized protein n=1 Tax=Choiromyces venosus 120613-1 TaxID=1336337 RepID=A0A3N4JH56_9PEZI|nr:hypothetical protein L873DRAFT_1811422 [Choiromyces venosus 120613-1]
MVRGEVVEDLTVPKGKESGGKKKRKREGRERWVQIGSLRDAKIWFWPREVRILTRNGRNSDNDPKRKNAKIHTISDHKKRGGGKTLLPLNDN